MEIAKIHVNGVQVTPVRYSEIPHGILGARIAFTFSDCWKDLNKTVVFDGCCVKDVVNAGDVVTIPGEVVAKPGVKLRVGVYGTDGENKVVIPTLWADLGKIRYAADPSGDATTDPQLPVWAQLQTMVETEAKRHVTAEGCVGEEPVEGIRLVLKQDIMGSALVGEVAADKLTVDSVHYQGKCLREIFDAGIIQGGDFEDGLPGIGGVKAANMPEELQIQSECCDLGNHALKLHAAGSGEAIVTLPEYTFAANRRYYLAMRAKVDAYTQGQFGIQTVANMYAPTEPTLGAWVTVSTVAVSSSAQNIATCIGGMQVSTLDNLPPVLTGYLDNVVLLDLTSVFGAGQEPDKGQMDQLYHLYIQLRRGIRKKQSFLLADSIADCTWPEAECIYAFVRAANRKAEGLGLTNSYFGSPSGMPGSPGDNRTTAADAMKLLISCYGSEILAEILRKKSCTFRSGGAITREIRVDSSLYGGALPDALGERGYYLFGGKGSGEGNCGILNWTVLCGVGDRQAAVTLMGQGLPDGAGIFPNPAPIICDVLDYFYDRLSGKTVEEIGFGPALTAALSRTEDPISVAACLLPGGSLRAWDGYSGAELLELSLGFAENEQILRNPASVSALMTARLVVDTVANLEEWVSIQESDITEGSGQSLYAGEIFSYKQLLYLMLLESNHTAANALARAVGQRLLQRGFWTADWNKVYELKHLMPSVSGSSGNTGVGITDITITEV